MGNLVFDRMVLICTHTYVHAQGLEFGGMVLRGELSGGGLGAREGGADVAAASFGEVDAGVTLRTQREPTLLTRIFPL